tara:strand:+ start:1479 stop:1730 length:252 start_codon:yes stop_codon:yes gene_type:complete
MSESRSLFQIPLIRELIIVLLIKLVLIFAIRFTFFSDPVELNDPHTDIAQQLGVCASGNDCAAPSSTSHSMTNASQQEDQHDQ